MNAQGGRTSTGFGGARYRITPLKAFDAGERARAVATVLEALAQAKTAGLEPAAVTQAIALANLEG
jgi:hypothetical protein